MHYHYLQSAVVWHGRCWSLQGYYRKGEIETATEHYKEAIDSYQVISQFAAFTVLFSTAAE